MDIDWYGHSCFRIRESGVVVVTDPYDKSIGLVAPRLRADIVTVSHDAPGHASVAGIKGDPKILTTPGEYEIHQVFVTGIQTWHQAAVKGEPKEENVVFVFEFGDLTVCHLGDLSQVLTQAQVEAMPSVDILMVPAGGGGALSADRAAEVVSLLEPKIVIPMHYAIPDLAIPMEPVGKFLKEMGAADLSPQESLRVNRSDLPEETQVVLLERRQS